MPLLALGSQVVLLEVSAVLLGILGLLTFLARRMKSGGPLRSRKVVPLTNQHALHVVELDGKRILIGTGPGGAPQLICELSRDSGDAERVEAATRDRDRPRWGGSLFGGR